MCVRVCVSCCYFLFVVFVVRIGVKSSFQFLKYKHNHDVIEVLAILFSCNVQRTCFHFNAQYFMYILSWWRSTYYGRFVLYLYYVLGYVLLFFYISVSVSSFSWVYTQLRETYVMYISICLTESIYLLHSNFLMNGTHSLCVLYLCR